MLFFGNKSKKEEQKKELQKIRKEKAKVLEEQKKLTETKKTKEPFAVPEMEASDLENYAIKLKIGGRTEDAFACTVKAAELGSCRSQYACGEASLEKGDFEKAAFWFEKAAEQGHFGAVFDLSKMILAGDAKMTDKFFAVLEEKAKYDNPQSCHYLGLMYYYGKGTEKDYPKAYFLIEKAKLFGYSDEETDNFLVMAKNQYMFKNGADSIYGFYGKLKKLYEKETGRAFYKEKAAEYMKKSFKPIKADITFEPGEEVYINGIEAKNEGRFEEAFELYRKAAGMGYAPAMTACAYCCIDGEGVPKNLEAARYFAIAGAKLGDIDCKLILKNYFNETV